MTLFCIMIILFALTATVLSIWINIEIMKPRKYQQHTKELVAPDYYKPIKKIDPAKILKLWLRP